MRNTLRVAAAFLVLALAPAPAFAWGIEAHRYIMGRAIDLLPPELKPFFERHRDEVVLRVVDPDLWRVVGWADNQNHFVDFGAPPFGKNPFDALPHEYDKAIEEFGCQTIDEYGTLPWTLTEFLGNLTRAGGAFT